MKNATSVWKILFSISSVLFFIVGFAKIFGDNAILEGAFLLLMAIFLLIVDVLVFKGKISLDRTKRRKHVPISLGFIFLIIGAVTLKNYGLAGLGFILMLVGLLRNSQEYVPPKK